jgi:hypothetical protein
MLVAERFREITSLDYNPASGHRRRMDEFSCRQSKSVLMAIDDQYDAIEKAFPEKEAYLPEDLAVFAAKFVLPDFVMDAFGTVFERLDRSVQLERAKATTKLLMADLKELKAKTASKEELNDLKEAMQLAIRHDVEEFNDKKRERYVKIIGNALRDERQIDDLASYIQDVERLGERDFIALKVLNKVMNQPRDTDKLRNFHPNDFIHRRQELAVEMAKALSGEFQGPSFSREQGYDACNRLQGFGLAHEIALGARQVPSGEYCFRPSRRGLMLLRLIGAFWGKYDIVRSIRPWKHSNTRHERFIHWRDGWSLQRLR